MERDPLTPEMEALWRRLWQLWQDADEADVILDTSRLEDLEAEIPALKGRVKTGIAYLQRAHYIQYRMGVGEDSLEPVVYDVYEPRG